MSNQRPTASPRRYATLADAADYLSCNERTIRRRIASGDIRAYRMGSKIIRVDLNELDASLRPIPTAGGAA